MLEDDPVEALYAKADRHRVPMSEVCDRAGVAQSTPSRWRNAAHGATLGKLNKLNKALDAIIRERNEGAPSAPEGAPPPFPNQPHRTDVPEPRAATNQPLPKVVIQTSSAASSPKSSPARSAASSAGCAGSDALDDREAA